MHLLLDRWWSKRYNRISCRAFNVNKKNCLFRKFVNKSRAKHWKITVWGKKENNSTDLSLASFVYNTGKISATEVSQGLDLLCFSFVSFVVAVI